MEIRFGYNGHDSAYGKVMSVVNIANYDADMFYEANGINSFSDNATKMFTLLNQTELAIQFLKFKFREYLDSYKYNEWIITVQSNRCCLGFRYVPDIKINGKRRVSPAARLVDDIINIAPPNVIGTELRQMA